MNNIADQKMLRDEQYKTARNLLARIEIHRRFSTNPCPWFLWEFQELAIQPGETVLDLGCGPAELWLSQKEKLPEDSRVTLCDLSAGMVKTAASNLAGETSFRYAVGDAQVIPLRDQSCDLVTANHMLYHVPNIDQAVREIKRVLKNGGRLVAATNGEAHLRELYELIESFLPGYTHATAGKRFGLETGAAYLRPYFDEVAVKPFQDNLWVTEVQPL